MTTFRRWVVVQDMVGNCALYHPDNWCFARFIPASQTTPKSAPLKLVGVAKVEHWLEVLKKVLDCLDENFDLRTGSSAEEFLYDPDGTWNPPTSVPEDWIEYEWGPE